MSSNKQPNNNTTSENPVGRFMVATGGIFELNNSRNILIIQRASHLDWHPNEWEIMYGRIDQFEDVESGLKRESKEELGLRDFEIIDISNVWHKFRGTEKIAQNDCIGITYWCRVTSPEVKLNSEHQSYKWVTPEEALSFIKIDGIREDIIKFIQLRDK